jgi:hypothetical protein
MQNSGMCPAFSDGMSGKKPAPAPKKQNAAPMSAERPVSSSHRRGGQAAKAGKK